MNRRNLLKALGLTAGALALPLVGEEAEANARRWWSLGEIPRGFPVSAGDRLLIEMGMKKIPLSLDDIARTTSPPRLISISIVHEGNGHIVSVDTIKQIQEKKDQGQGLIQVLVQDQLAEVRKRIAREDAELGV